MLFSDKAAGQAMDHIYTSLSPKYVLTLEIGGSTFNVTSEDIPTSTQELKTFLKALTSQIRKVSKSKPSHDEM